MRLILLGAPGAGKGTQAVTLSKKLNIPHISTGDIFRSNIKNGTPLGKMAKEYIDKGGLVPDEVTIGIVKDRLQNDDCNKGFILDGFPRTIPQAENLDKVLEEMDASIDYAVDIYVNDEEIIKRISGRRVCPECGKTYHLVSGPPKTSGICDVCDTALIQRDDDKEETVFKRLKTYHEMTEPLIEYYKKRGKLLTVDGGTRISDTAAAIYKALGLK